mmetsp:Transcript_48648/g.89678  ORF Transcript_48648/g.89678 Transcript_48648/m.89678 type:complete len:411 (+) Transcript_48648:49-1281(+)
MPVDVLVGRGKYSSVDVPEGCTVGSWKRQLSEGSLGDKILYATKLSLRYEENGRALAEAAALPDKFYVDGPFSVLQMLELALRKYLASARKEKQTGAKSLFEPPTATTAVAIQPSPAVANEPEGGWVEPDHGQLRSHCAGRQGYRPYMEDRTVAVTALPHCEHAGLYGVFDGHGGAEVAEACAELMPGMLAEALLQSSSPHDALEKAFCSLDEELRAIGHNSRGPHKFNRVGCTACVALVLKEANRRRRVICANCGDSRAVLCKGGVAIDLSFDHKPNDAAERARIVAAGGRVDLFGPCWRIDAGLNLSRAMGDFWYKSLLLPRDEQKVTSIPDLHEIALEPADEFIVIGSDGIFDVMSSQELVDTLRGDLAKGMPLEEVIEACLQRSLSSGDNVSLCLMQFSSGAAARL